MFLFPRGQSERLLGNGQILTGGSVPARAEWLSSGNLAKQTIPKTSQQEEKNQHRHQNKAFQQFPAQLYPEHPVTSLLPDWEGTCSAGSSTEILPHWLCVFGHQGGGRSLLGSGSMQSRELHAQPGTAAGMQQTPHMKAFCARPKSCKQHIPNFME